MNVSDFRKFPASSKMSWRVTRRRRLLIWKAYCAPMVVRDCWLARPSIISTPQPAVVLPDRWIRKDLPIKRALPNGGPMLPFQRKRIENHEITRNEVRLFRVASWFQSLTMRLPQRLHSQPCRDPFDLMNPHT